MTDSAVGGGPTEVTRRAKLVELALLFLRLGFTAFGGPAAHVAIMQEEIVRRRRWLAQPAVSRQIRHLEDELGALLFVRTPRGMMLSESGRIFLGHARSILDGVRAAQRAVRGQAAHPVKPS
jgi:hypothetical protein